MCTRYECYQCMTTLSCISTAHSDACETNAYPVHWSHTYCVQRWHNALRCLTLGTIRMTWVWAHETFCHLQCSALWLFSSTTRCFASLSWRGVNVGTTLTTWLLNHSSCCSASVNECMRIVLPPQRDALHRCCGEEFNFPHRRDAEHRCRGEEEGLVW